MPISQSPTSPSPTSQSPISQSPTSPSPTTQLLSNPRLRFSAYNVWVEHDDAHHVFNAASGELRALSPAEYEAVHRFTTHGQIANVHGPVAEDLITSRIIVDARTDELGTLKRRFVQASSSHHHLGLTIVTSMGCNFDCPYCFEHKRPSLLKSEVIEALLDLIDRRMPALDTLRITWYGGEPLLGADQLVDLSTSIAQRCVDAGVDYSSIIVTNGWHLDAAMAKRLAAADVHHAQVTIDGPPDLHNSMRPLVNGGDTFDRIVGNLREAIDHLPITIRVNVDGGNVERLEELLRLLKSAGLAGRAGIALGHIVPVSHNELAPSASYSSPCLTIAEFGEAQLAFDELANSWGFGAPTLPGPVDTPCTAGRTNELLVGADGELWKCLDDAGNSEEQIGTIFDLTDFNTRAAKWFEHDPFSDDECVECVALPVCMGGCALFGRVPELRDNRCATFRTHHVEQVQAAVSGSSDRSDALRRLNGLSRMPATSVPVTLGART